MGIKEILGIGEMDASSLLPPVWGLILGSPRSTTATVPLSRVGIKGGSSQGVASILLIYSI